MTTPRTKFVAALLVTGATLLVACSKPAPQQPAPPPPPPKPPATLWERYADLKLVDVHSHDAAGAWQNALQTTWSEYHVDRIALMGNVSEPQAVETDKIAWTAYSQHPDRIYPIFSGFDLHDAGGLAVVKQNLEQGYFGLGEVVAASTASPIVSRVKWKGLDAMDGFLPDIYKLCAEYGAPILLHIDPPTKKNLAKLEEALDTNPKTAIIWGHANVYVEPATIDEMMKKHPNLYVDFFAGFAEKHPDDGGGPIADFIPMIKAHPDRILLGSDSGYGMTKDEAYQAMYKVLDQVDPATAKKIASENYTRLIEAQPVTKTQLAKLQELATKTGKPVEAGALNKRRANELIFQLSK